MVGAVYALFLIFALATGIIFIKRHFAILPVPARGAAVVPVASSKPKTEPAPAEAVPAKTQPPKPVKFDFYNLLPKVRVTVNSKTPAQPATVAATPVASHYILQLASLGSEAAARTFQANLRVQGFQTKLLPVIRTNGTLYRVQMGPYNQLADAQAMHDELAAQKVVALLVPIRA